MSAPRLSYYYYMRLSRSVETASTAEMVSAVERRGLESLVSGARAAAALPPSHRISSHATASPQRRMCKCVIYSE